MTKSKIEEDKYYKDLKRDPIAVLKKIIILVHDPIKSKYTCSDLTKLLRKILNCKQQEGENFLEYTMRFKQIK